MKRFNLSFAALLVIGFCCLGITGCKRAPLFSQKDKFVKISEKQSDDFNLSYRYNIRYLIGFSYWISPREYVKYYPNDNKYESLGEFVPQKFIAYYSLVANNPRSKIINRFFVYLKGLAVEIILLVILLWIISRKNFFDFFVHYFISLPTTFILLAVMLIKIFAWLGLDIAAKWAPMLDTTILGPYVGFKNGFTPISSWHNFFLYLLTIILGFIIVMPIMIFFFTLEWQSKDPGNKLAIRFKCGAALDRIQKIAEAFLIAIIILTILEILMPPFDFWLKGAMLLSFGILWGINNLKYSDYGDKYGMMMLSYKNAVKMLARDLNLSDMDVDASYMAWIKHAKKNI